MVLMKDFSSFPHKSMIDSVNPYQCDLQDIIYIRPPAMRGVHSEADVVHPASELIKMLINQPGERSQHVKLC